MSDTGVQDRKVLLERKLVKKVGQDVEVKLLPREVSKGDGRGVVMTVVEGAVSKVVVEVGSGDVLEDGMDIEVAVVVTEVSSDEDAEVDAAAGGLLVLVDSSRTWRLSRPTTGSGLASKCISPLCSSSRKCTES